MERKENVFVCWYRNSFTLSYTTSKQYLFSGILAKILASSTSALTNHSELDWNHLCGLECLQAGHAFVWYFSAKVCFRDRNSSKSFHAIYKIKCNTSEFFFAQPIVRWFHQGTVERPQNRLISIYFYNAKYTLLKYLSR